MAMRLMGREVRLGGVNSGAMSESISRWETRKWPPSTEMRSERRNSTSLKLIRSESFRNRMRVQRLVKRSSSPEVMGRKCRPRPQAAKSRNPGSQSRAWTRPDTHVRARMQETRSQRVKDADMGGVFRTGRVLDPLSGGFPD